MLIPRRGRTYVRRYRSSSGSNVDRTWFGGILLYLFLLVSVGFWAYNEYFEREMRMAFDEVENLIVEANQMHYYNQDKLVYFHNNQIKPSDELVDPDFQLLAPPHGLKMKRIEEYCQWIEYTSTHTYRDSEGNTVETTTYYYKKDWVTTPILSLFFDQAFTHHNPLRQPFPSKYWQTEKAQVGEYNINYDLVGMLKSFQPLQPTINDLQSFTNSAASLSLENKFAYIGNGYFYSAYEEVNGIRLARIFGEFMEGSLLDFQLADLFPQCTAGDVRVHFEVAAPSHVSVIGKQLDEHGNVGLWTTSRGFNVGYVHDGVFSPEEIFERELSDQHWLLIVLRVVVSLFLFFVSWFHTDRSFDQVLLTFTISLIVTWFSLAHILLYPLNWLTWLAFLMGAIGLYFNYRRLFYVEIIPEKNGEKLQ